MSTSTKPQPPLQTLSPRASSTATDVLSRTIPWSNLPNPASQAEYRINLSINNIRLNCPLDTGSTTFLVSASIVNHTPSTLAALHLSEGFHYLSSSHRYYKGYWLPSTVTFTSLANTTLTSKIEVLAVTERGKCTKFNVSKGTCEGKTDVELMPGGIKYLGVGFGRWSSEQPGGVVARNALLNVEFADAAVRSGFVVSDTGVRVGFMEDEITEGNVEGWKLVRLSRNLEAPGQRDGSARPEWTGTPMSVAVNGGQRYHGTALFDTGIDCSFLGVPKKAVGDVRLRVDDHWELMDGTEVAVEIGNAEEEAAIQYKFKVGGESVPVLGMTPKRVQLGRVHADGAFINTGRFVYNGLELLFDQLGGTVGLKIREKQNVN